MRQHDHGQRAGPKWRGRRRQGERGDVGWATRERRERDGIRKRDGVRQRRGTCTVAVAVTIGGGVGGGDGGSATGAAAAEARVGGDDQPDELRRQVAVDPTAAAAVAVAFIVVVVFVVVATTDLDDRSNDSAAAAAFLRALFRRRLNVGNAAVPAAPAVRRHFRFVGVLELGRADVARVHRTW